MSSPCTRIVGVSESARSVSTRNGVPKERPASVLTVAQICRLPASGTDFDVVSDHVIATTSPSAATRGHSECPLGLCRSTWRSGSHVVPPSRLRR